MDVYVLHDNAEAAGGLFDKY
jgi:hypothetical protein